jgi:transcriptional regulator with XRE-family HTH domain
VDDAHGREYLQLMDSIRRQFAANARDLRIKSGMTQKGVAERAEFHPRYIGKIERGEVLPRFEATIRLAAALGVEAGRLFAGIAWEPPRRKRSSAVGS